MLDPVRQTILYDQNAIYYGYPIAKLMARAGQGIADVLLAKYGSGRRIGFICGPGNNGGDGLAAAKYLGERAQVEVYLIPDQRQIKTVAARKYWRLFKGVKYDNVSSADLSDHFDIVVDCLFGTGVSGRLEEPYLSVVRKMNRMSGKKVTIDLPTPGFRAQHNISMMFPKAPGADVVDIGFPKNIARRTGVGEVKVLNRPAAVSHKGDNGSVLIIGGSEKYHGAPLLAVQIAAKIVDLVYFSSLPGNIRLIEKMKSKSAEFITLAQDEIDKYMKRVNVVLLGPGLGVSDKVAGLVNGLLKKYRRQKFVLDADALKVLDKKLLNENCIITPHRREFKILFNQAANEKNVIHQAKKYGCVIILKGKKDIVATAGEVKYNYTGNAGMTKGGTGDVLAGLIASLAARNELFLAAAAGVFINGLAGDRLKKRLSYYYSAGDLVREIPRAIKWCEDY